MKLIITNHARLRAKQRFNWRLESLKRMAIRSIKSGLDVTNANGKIQKYINNLAINHNGRANNVKIYGEQIYLFRDEVLLTVLHLPNELKSISRKTRGRKHNEIQN